MEGCTFHNSVIAIPSCSVCIVIGLLIMRREVLAHWYSFILINLGRVVVLVVNRDDSWGLFSIDSDTVSDEWLILFEIDACIIEGGDFGLY